MGFPPLGKQTFWVCLRQHGYNTKLGALHVRSRNTCGRRNKACGPAKNMCVGVRKGHAHGELVSCCERAAFFFFPPGVCGCRRPGGKFVRKQVCGAPFPPGRFRPQQERTRWGRFSLFFVPPFFFFFPHTVGAPLLWKQR